MITSQAAHAYYQKYKINKLEINNEIAQTIGMRHEQTALKINNNFLPCRIISLSMMKARVFLSTQFQQVVKSVIVQKIPVKFKIVVDLEGEDASQFLLIPTEMEIEQGGGHEAESSAFQDALILTLTYTTRSPDAYIEMIAPLLDINTSLAQNIVKHLPATDLFLRRFGLKNKEVELIIDGETHRAELDHFTYTYLVVVAYIPNSSEKNGKEVALRAHYSNGTAEELKGTIAPNPDNVGLAGGKANWDDEDNPRDFFRLTLDKPPIEYQIFISKNTIA